MNWRRFARLLKWRNFIIAFFITTVVSLLLTMYSCRKASNPPNVGDDRIRRDTITTDGRMRGYVLPVTARATVHATNGVDTYSTMPAEDGFYMFTNLPADTYKLIVDAPPEQFRDVTLENIQVSYGIITDVGTVELKK